MCEIALIYFLNTEQLRRIFRKLLKISNVKQVFMKPKKLWAIFVYNSMARLTKEDPEVLAIKCWFLSLLPMQGNGKTSFLIKIILK